MAETGTATAEAVVTEIFIYPIKSCRGIPVSQAAISATGFRWDRQWVVINANGKAYTQRTVPKFALIQVDLPTEAFSEGWEPNIDSYLVIRAPGMDELKVPLSKPSLTSDGVSVWEWSGSALDEGDEAAKWFTDYIKKPCRLVRFNEESETRPVDPKYTSGFNVMFSDAFPFQVISQGSLDALNEHLQEKIAINRFRPNILVDGCKPFAEDLWKDLKINKLAFQGVCLCPRCKVPTINQEKGTPGREPNETLKNFRSDKVLPMNRNEKGKVYFGQYLVCKDRLIGGTVKVGDPIYVETVYESYAETPIWLD